MLERRADLVLEGVAVDGLAAAPRARGVAALDHEAGDDAVEDHVVVVAALRERREVLACLSRARGEFSAGKDGRRGRGTFGASAL